MNGKTRKTCMTCGNRYTENNDKIHYDHFVKNRCRTTGHELTDDICNTVCDKWTEIKELQRLPDEERDAFLKKCYGIYKLQWCVYHGISLETLLAKIQEVHYADDTCIADRAELWETMNIYGSYDENGETLESFEGGGFWESPGIFERTLFKDRDVMASLLGESSKNYQTWKRCMIPKTEDKPSVLGTESENTNVVYCDRKNCANYKDGHCLEIAIAIEDNGFCGSYNNR